MYGCSLSCSICRYQGFATGDCERDARAPRMFLEQGHAIGLSQSFAKVSSVPCSKIQEALHYRAHIQVDPRMGQVKPL